MAAGVRGNMPAFLSHGGGADQRVCMRTHVACGWMCSNKPLRVCLLLIARKIVDAEVLAACRHNQRAHRIP